MKKPTLKRDLIKKLLCAELRDRRFIVDKKKDNKDFHILCKSADGAKSVKIRMVKSKDSMRNWTLNMTDEWCSGDLFYVFVGSEFLEKQDFFVIPSIIVSPRLIENAHGWSSGSKKDGGVRKILPTREFVMKDSEVKKYKNNWKSLGLD